MTNVVNIDIKKQSVQEVLDSTAQLNAKAIMVVSITEDGLINCEGSNMSILEIFGAMDAAKMHIWEVMEDD